MTSKRMGSIYFLLGIVIILVLSTFMMFSNSLTIYKPSSVKVVDEVIEGEELYQVYTISLTKDLHLSNKPIPYKIVNIKRFENTLVTFKLPEKYGFKYISIVWINDHVIAYLFNSLNDKPVVYSRSRIVSSYHYSSPPHYVGKGYVIINYNIIAYETELPGGYKDPTIRAYQEVYFYNSLNMLIFKVRAEGTFNYIPNGEITGIGPAGSGAWAYSGVSVCYKATYVDGVGATIGYVQEDGGGASPTCPVIDWYAGWPIVQLNTWTGQVTMGEEPYNSGTSLGCGCSGINWNIVFPPPGEG